VVDTLTHIEKAKKVALRHRKTNERDGRQHRPGGGAIHAPYTGDLTTAPAGYDASKGVRIDPHASAE